MRPPKGQPPLSARRQNFKENFILKLRSPKPKAPPLGRFVANEKGEPSMNQLCPALADPHDFEIMENGGLGGDTLPFDGSCGDSPAEYRKLLKTGRAGNKKPSTPRDNHGRTLN